MPKDEHIIVIEVNGERERFPLPHGYSKSDIARELLRRKHSVAGIAKAVPMAYSQVHQIAAKLGKLPGQDPERIKNIEYHTGRKVKPHPSVTAKNVTPKPKPIAAYAGGKRPTSKARVEEAKVWAGKRADKAVSRIFDESTVGAIAEQRQLSGRKVTGKKLGKCRNCGYEILGAKLGGQMQMIHVGMNAETYMATVQFCHAYPASLAA